MPSPIHRFSNALFVALNDEPEPPDALGDAVEFARTAGVSLTLFDAVPPVSRVQQHLRIGNKRIEEAHDATLIRREQLHRWADVHRTRLRMGYVVSCGRRSVEASHRVTASGHDLIIVAPNGTDDDLTVVRRLLRVAPCAVLVLRRSILSGAVLVAIDPEDDTGLNEVVLRSASAIASIGQRSLHVVHAYEPHGLTRIRSSQATRFNDEAIDTFVDAVRDAHRLAVNELIERVDEIADVETHVDLGSPLEVIARRAVELDSSIVTVGTGGRRGTSALLMGTTADRVITHTSASVLVVKAPGLVPLTDDVDEWARSVGGPSAVATARPSFVSGFGRVERGEGGEPPA